MASSELVETVAKAIHVARFKTPGARPVEPMGPADHEYCNRLASAALTAIQPLLSATHYADNPDKRPIMLQIAEADDTHRMWERRWQALMALNYHNTRFADRAGEWRLSDFITYAGQACGFERQDHGTSETE